MRQGGKIQVEVRPRIEQHCLTQKGYGLRRLSQGFVRVREQLERDWIGIRGLRQRFEHGKRVAKAGRVD